LLIDVFERELPLENELQARAEYAETHGLRYVIVEPGHYLPIQDLIALGREGRGGDTAS
jgi:hypothetical protein